jgi:hypothetical protein
MDDLTIIYYTGNRIDNKLFRSTQEVLIQAAGIYPIISVTQKPMKLGYNICLGDIGYSYINIYKQMLIGAKEAKTKFVAIAEDDTLYCPHHFNRFRPPADTFGYNMNRWLVYTWTEPPIYSMKKKRFTNAVLIAPRELLIDALEERFAKYPKESEIPIKLWSEFGKYEKDLGVKVQKTIDFATPVSVIQFTHPDCINFEYQGTKKKLGDIRAYDIPYWGRAEDLMEKYYKENNET